MLLISQPNSACRRSGAALAIAADGPLKCIKIRRFNETFANVRRAFSLTIQQSLQARMCEEFAILTRSLALPFHSMPRGVGNAPRLGRALRRGISRARRAATARQQHQEDAKLVQEAPPRRQLYFFVP